MLIDRRRLTAALSLGACAVLAPSSSTPGVQLSGGSDFPNVLLFDQNGRPLRFYDDFVRGKHTVAVNFIYAQCGDICPMTTANLVKVQELLGERLGHTVRLASISIDPTRDNPNILKAYAANFGARAGWQFFWGKFADVDLIRRRLGVYERDPARDRDLTQHTGMLVYGNEARDRWGRISALAEPERIVEQITRWS